MAGGDHDPTESHGLMATWIELAIRLGGARSAALFGLHPDSPLHHDRDLERRADGGAVSRLRPHGRLVGGRRRLAAVLLTVIGLLS